jgi:sterol desaturase/sphingolipid hydroxylase (fatty acid hydroxylase superfamily)
MNGPQYLILLAIMASFAVFEVVSGRYRDLRPTADDTKLEAGMFLALMVVIQPTIFLLTQMICIAAIPSWRGVWSQMPRWSMALILVVADDMTQYWWHRVSHSPRLWPLHRPHHSAHYMSIRVTYRNNFFYYLMMPGIWLSAVLVYLGLAKVYLVYIVIKLVVILGAHSAVRWDEPLYRIKWLNPLAWIVERMISTPATHWAHHALTERDGIGHYSGNFGNLLFFWDVLFGTAKITRRYPVRIGLQDDLVYGKERWFTEMLYPLVRSRRPHSAFAVGRERQAATELPEISVSKPAA